MSIWNERNHCRYFPLAVVLNSILLISSPSTEQIYLTILCLFVMIAECHYDGTPNFVASVGGLRRWIMAAPSECDKLYLLQKPSTSSRHSRVDWSAPDDSKYPHFKEALANEIILKPGDMLFVPGYWFHYIVSLNVNFQCNCRVAQGGTRINRYRNVIHKCGTF